MLQTVGSLALQFFGISGTEDTHETWDGIIQSGILKDGGLIVAHGQGAQIVTHSLARRADDEIDYSTKANLVLLGGAHTRKPLDMVERIVDIRQSPDLITAALHNWGDLFQSPEQSDKYFKYEAKYYGEKLGWKDLRKPAHLKVKRTRRVPTYEQWHWKHSGIHTWGHYRKPLQDMFKKYELFWTGEK